MSDGKPNYAHRLNEAARLIIRWGRSHLDLTGKDIDRGAKAVRNDPTYREEVARAAINRAMYDFELKHRLVEARDLLDTQPLPYGRRCWYTFDLPSWAGEDQMDPCRCVLHNNHEGDHECKHTRARKT